MWMALGGLALLMLGLRQLGKALQTALGGSARRWLTWATQNASRATLVGTLIGASTLNSGGLAVGALQLCESGVARFGAALMLGLGAKAGATVALLLSSTPISVFALPMIGVGYLLTLYKTPRVTGEALSGIGLLLYGLSLMVQGFSGMAQSEVFLLLEQSLESAPLGLWVLGFGLAALLGSANAVGAIALALTGSQVLPLTTALALTLGGGAGSGVLLLVSSNAASIVPKRVAWTHLGWKTLFSLGWLVWLPFLQLDVIWLHALYHALAALMALPMIGILEGLATRHIKDTTKPVAPKYLSADALSSSQFATALALREVSRVGDQVLQMLEQTTKTLETGDGDVEEIARLESKIDTLTRDVVLYLSELGSRHGSNTPLMLVMAVSELEHIGDQTKRVLRMNNKLAARNLEFSVQGRAELHQASLRVLERLNLALAALATRNHPLAERVLGEREDMEHFLTELKRSHLSRLEMGRIESRATTLTHLDLLIVLDEIDQGAARLATISQDLEQPVQVLGGGVN
jgi:phosphate:Na+ symporter